MYYLRGLVNFNDSVGFLNVVYTQDPTERDADEVRSRMASLQRGWQRGREENDEGDGAQGVSAPRGTTKGDGR